MKGTGKWVLKECEDPEEIEKAKPLRSRNEPERDLEHVDTRASLGARAQAGTPRQEEPPKEEIRAQSVALKPPLPVPQPAP